MMLRKRAETKFTVSLRSPWTRKVAPSARFGTGSRSQLRSPWTRKVAPSARFGTGSRSQLRSPWTRKVARSPRAAPLCRLTATSPPLWGEPPPARRSPVAPARRLPRFARRIAEIVGGDDGQSACGQQRLPLLDVGALEPDPQRYGKAPLLRRRDDARRDDVALHDPAEDVDQHRLHLRVHIFCGLMKSDIIP